MAFSIAVVGTGYWGRNHLRTLAALQTEGLLDRLIVCDVDEVRAREMADKDLNDIKKEAEQLDQLKPGGRMIIPIGRAHDRQTLILVVKDASGQTTTDSVLPVSFVPMVRGKKRN